MPWREPSTAPFTRIGIVCNVPPGSGVFGIIEGDTCVYLGETWNLRNRLLDIVNVIVESDKFSIIWEECPEALCASRRQTLEQELLPPTDPAVPKLPGIHLRPEIQRRIA